MTDDLAVLAHELRTPIAALGAILETLAERGDSLSVAERERFVELALLAGRDVERLLTPSPAITDVVDVATLVREVADTAAAAGAHVRVDVEPGLPAIHGDAATLRQALRNLVENAVGHSPAGATVVIGARVVNDAIALAVMDVGEGIAVADQARIFEAGTRLTDARPGSGIGLAVVRTVAESHGGTVRVESSPGQGATFTLVLPPASSNG